MVPDKQGILDKITAKLISRKFLVFIIASVGLFLSSISSSDWVQIASIFIAGEALIDSIGTYRKPLMDNPNSPPVITNNDEQNGV